MIASRNSPAVSGAWSPYVPSAGAPWDQRRVVHLHRRAGFAATREELRRDLAEGPGPSVDRFLEGRGQSTAVSPEHETLLGRIGDAAVASRDPDRLKAWWALRMLAAPDALGERLTLMWHGRFATSERKVRNLDAMRRQNELFRRLARGPYGDLLAALLRDPAMLVWLDAPANRKDHPNENLARELMELFTVGVGRFAETDVREAARALTGLTTRDDAFVDNPLAHDAGEKTLFGQTGPFSAADVVRILLYRPEAAGRLAELLCRTFMGEKSVGPDDVDALADGLRTHRLDVGWGVATILRSRAFFADANIRTRIAGPAEFVIGSVRAIGRLAPTPSVLALASWITRMGQDLFHPPNVGGWTGGRDWLTTRGIVARANFASALASGDGLDIPPADALGLADCEPGGPLDQVVGSLATLLLGDDPGPDWRSSIVKAAGGGPATPESARAAAALILSSPEASLT